MAVITDLQDLMTDLLKLPTKTCHDILNYAPHGLATAHGQCVAHTEKEISTTMSIPIITFADVKLNNIPAEYERDDDPVISIGQTQLVGTGDAALGPSGCNDNWKTDNWTWLSPEAHVHGPVNKPSDILISLQEARFGLLNSRLELILTAYRYFKSKKQP